LLRISYLCSQYDDTHWQHTKSNTYPPREIGG
jgi:hypothetical protein